MTSSSIHVDVLIPTVGRTSLTAARRSAERAVLPSDGVTLHLHVVDDDERRGPAWARNRAAEQGTAPYIALLDDDDQWLPGRLSRAIPLLRDRPEVALVCGDALPRYGGLFLAGDPRGSGRPATIEPGDHSHADLVRDCFVAASTVTMRRTDWEAMGGMPEDCAQAEDYALWLRLTADGRPVHVLMDALARLRTDGDGLSDRGNAAATLASLERYAQTAVPPKRRATLLASASLDARAGGDRAGARRLARQALRLDPATRMPWKAAIKAWL